MERQDYECKAAVAWEAGKPLSIKTMEIQPHRKGKVKIKLVVTGAIKEVILWRALQKE
jgi:S-(hydroxymethyl)glutathione dehydrogenase/alcohol dehydrogenase